MPLEHLIATYGYVAVLLGTFFEGETVLVLAGLAAQQGYLELPWVVVNAFVGTLVFGQICFSLGRAKGRSILERRPIWKAKSDKVLALMHEHQVWIILGFRFLYGMRTVTPFVLGLSHVAPLRFAVLNIVGSAMWAAAIGILGYLFGDTLEIILGDFKRYQWWLYAGLAIAGVAVWSLYGWKQRRARARLIGLRSKTI